MDVLAGMFVGFMVSFMASALIWGFAIMPTKVDAQFKKDCVAMAHGTVDKSANNICVKNGQILFHK